MRVEAMVNNLDFSKSWNSSDVVLIVEGHEVHAHKCILSLWSPVFDRMFSSDFIEKNAKQIVLHGKNLNDFIEMLRIIYDRRKQVTGENCHALLTLADEYQMDQLRSACEDYLGTTDKQGLNSVRLLEIAKQFNLHAIERTCLENAKSISTDVLELSVDYQRLSNESKVSLLTSRVKHLEKLLNEYESTCVCVVEYLYHQAHESLVTYLQRQGLENTSIITCDQYASHKAKRAGNGFCMHCTACRERTKHSRQFTVTTNEISAVLDKLYRLVYTNT